MVGQRARIDNVEHRRKGGGRRGKKRREQRQYNENAFSIIYSRANRTEPSIPSDSIRLVHGNNVVSLLDTGKEILFFPEHPF